MRLTTAMLDLGTRVTPRILIYSATAGYRHESIPVATIALEELGQQHGIAFDATEDRTQFDGNSLEKYDAILFLSNSGEGKSFPIVGKQAFQTYLDKGGNYIGIHAASACLYNTAFYHKEVGTQMLLLGRLSQSFKPTHGRCSFRLPPGASACAQTFLVLDKDHPSTTMLPDRWTYKEEVYNFRSDPRSIGAKILLSVDPSSYTDTHIRTYDQGSPHPIGSAELIHCNILTGCRGCGRLYCWPGLLHQFGTPRVHMDRSDIPHARTWWYPMGLGIEYDTSNEPKRTSGSSAVKHVIKGGKHAYWIGASQTFSWDILDANKCSFDKE
ncbi:ThuA domain-containing protein [Rhizoctonia solani AG-1 IA]|uniref:ThuA domain-containing protein n=1 Tax=Thanatephorus cucumeris (strain AG1-IA) TaxID=983506 RepID=L8WV04_THACA|nr:ThuA domain-containing protein [Rhizoctonia solani AG-1 IA]